MEISPSVIETTDQAFAKIARIAGDRMRLKLLQPGIRFEHKNAWFEIFNPFKDDYREVLQEVKRCFEDELFDRRHPMKTFGWRSGFIVTRTKEIDEHTFKEMHGDLWVLALSVARHSSEGLSFDLHDPVEAHKSLHLQKNDVYLAYLIVEP